MTEWSELVDGQAKLDHDGERMECGPLPTRRSLKFYESCARLLRGVADGEAVLLGALLHALCEGHAHGEGGDDQDGEESERLLHGVLTRFDASSFCEHMIVELV